MSSLRGLSRITRCILDGYQAVDASSYSFGIANVVSDGGSGAGAGKAVLSDFTFTKKMDASSSKLFKACASGTHIKSATIVLRDTNGNTLNQLLLKEVVVRSVQTSSDGTSVSESIALAYSQIEFNF